MCSNLLVTGCAGFIGLNFLEKFVLRNHQYDNIVSIDKMGYATQYNKDVYYNLCQKHNIIYFETNLNTMDAFPTVYNWDVLNFASESHVDNSIQDPFTIFKENSNIPMSIIRILNGIEHIEKFYHISTDEVYSEIPLDKVHDKSNWFTPHSSIKPNNPYSASKAAQDCFLMSLRHTFGLDVKFIRMANQQPGKYQHKEKMLMASILRVLNGEPVKIYGKGENIRQWTPVDITADIICDVMESKFEFDDVLHIANINGIFNNNEIIDMLETCMNEYGYTVHREYIEDRLGHDTAYALQTTLHIDNYFKNASVKDQMKSCIEYCIKNKEKFLNG